MDNWHVEIPTTRRNQDADWLLLVKTITTLNYLNSTIGAEIGSLPKLVTLRLDNNYRLDDDGILISYGIRGSMPGSIGDLKQLEELRLDNNYVGGTLPASLGNLQKLVSLRLESNNLQSSIPSTLGNLAR